MHSTNDFEDIRCYSDEEVNGIVRKLCQENFFIQMLQRAFSGSQLDSVIEKIQQINTVSDFQRNVIVPYAEGIIKQTSKGLTSSGLEKLDKNGAYLFISNHRDIILDSAFLNVSLFKNGFDSTEIAIGSNLMIFPWITDLMKLNRSFVVHRNVPMRQMREYSIKLATYIRKKITESKTSIWIAQREGRTKDGNDRTQVALLKMLSMNQDDFLSAMSDLHIVPVSISYELEPCADLKARELFIRVKNPYWQKKTKDDLQSMMNGLTNDKGRIHITFGDEITKQEIVSIDHLNTKNKFLELARLIDKQIHQNYKLWTYNYVAFDLLNGTESYREHYSDADVNSFEAYVDQILKNAEVAEADARTFMYKLYAYPLSNINEWKTNVHLTAVSE